MTISLESDREHYRQKRISTKSAMPLVGMPKAVWLARNFVWFGSGVRVRVRVGVRVKVRVRIRVGVRVRVRVTVCPA